MSLPDKRDRISHRAPRLLWQQGHDDVLADIRSGLLAVDDRLPGELEMADQYGVSRDVIRRAKEELAGQGWLIVLHGRGTFVAHPAAAGDVSQAGGEELP
jgi:DNA-binding GntR family transcriptional regulator